MIVQEIMGKQITLALVGRGHWGKTYQKTINEMTGFALPEKFIFGRDYKKRLKKINTADIDGVIIAATTSAHFEIASFLLENGFKNLLIEKPLTQTFQQAKKLDKLAKNTPDAKILVGHLMLYDPAWIAIKKSLKKLGNLSQINYAALKGPPIKEGTVLQDAGPHPIYLFMDIAGVPKKITAKPKKFDNVELTLEFENGLLGVAELGTIYPERKRQIMIVGEKSQLILNEFVNPRQLQLINQRGNYKLLRFSTNKSPLELEILEFARMIKDGKSSVPLASGMDVVKIIELAEESLSKHKVLSLR